MSQTFPEYLVTRVRRMIRKGAYTLRTGYWRTGERVCPDFPDENFANHLKVYRFASQFIGGRRVLDVGCGTGYGSAHLSELASFVVGVDVSRQAIKYARGHYASPKVQYLQMNAESLRFPDRSFDFIISTENFEHLHDQRANLRESARVLKEDGMLLLATPNHEMFIGNDNPHHTHEVVYEELLDMVHEFFDECLIAENSLAPSTEEGRKMRAERKSGGAEGANLLTDPLLWRQRIDTTWLSNTHSFFCFARKPRDLARGGA